MAISPFNQSDLDGSKGFVLNGINKFDYSVRPVNSARNVNGDALDDLSVNTPFADPNGNYSAGESYVVFSFRSVLGTPGDDILNGTGSNNLLAGLEADDRLSGGDGDDVLRGDLNSRNPQMGIGGNDTLFGGAGNDRLSGKGGNDQLFGEAGDDRMWGDDGNDTLRGGLGNDRLVGDDFSGGQGNDIFVLAPGEGTDTIVDFEDGVDFISLAKGLTFDRLSITSDSGSNTLISFGSETLAVLNGIPAADLTEADFVVNNLSFQAARFFDSENNFDATADFNGDGIADGVSANLGNTLTVLLGRANGTFGDGVNYAVGDAIGVNAEAVTIADFNNDGNADIAVANSFVEEDVSLLLGNGDGTFVGSRTFAVADKIENLDLEFVVTADFNNDGIIDVATQSPTFDFVSGDFFPGFAAVLIGKGDGTFEPAVRYTVENSESAIAVGDVNNDGITDLVSIYDSNNEDSVSVLLGNGDGTFQAATKTEFGTGGFDSSITVADFDGDGFDDLVFTDNSGYFYDPDDGFNSIPRVGILLSNGDGTFGNPLSFPVGNDPKAPTAADFNGDGILDLAVANYYTDYGSDALSTVSILLGNGDGTFADDVQYTVGSRAREIGVGDFNGDGVTDLAVANVSSSFVSVLIGVGDGTFNPTNNIATDERVLAVTVEDIDGDRIEDLVVATVNDDVVILNGEGNGNFIPGESFASGAFALSTLTTADLNNDLAPDVIAIRDNLEANRDDVAILLNEGDGSLQFTPRIDVPGTVTLSVANGDFNRDGVSDLAVADGDVSILISNGDDGFADPVVEVIADQSTDVAVADLDDDGLLDLVVTSTDEVDLFDPGFGRDGKVSILLGNGDGTFSDAVANDIGGEPRSVVIGDVNQDGIQDLVVGNLSRDRVSVLLGNGNGTFNNAVDYNVILPPEEDGEISTSSIKVELEDFDGDGIIDVVANNRNSTVVLSGNGDGTFVDTPLIATDLFSIEDIIAEDFNNDGRDDLLALESFDEVSVLIAEENGTFEAPLTSTVGNETYDVVVGEFNGDGILDIVTEESYDYYGNERINLFLGNGDGSFGDGVILESSIRASETTVNDFNGDGFDDIAISNNVFQYVPDPNYYYGGYEFVKSQVSVLLSNNDGTFNKVDTDISDRDSILGIIDVDGDGVSDIITNQAVQFGNGDGTFSDPATLSTQFGSRTLIAPGDFNGDGNADLVTNATSNGVSILLGNGEGTFNEGGEFITGANAQDINVADYDGDGIEDIAVSNFRENNVAILVGNGDGTFKDTVKFSVEGLPGAIATGDFENNGSNDLAVASTLSLDGISILLNDSNLTPVNTPPAAVADSFFFYNQNGAGLDLGAGAQFAVLPDTPVT